MNRIMLAVAVASSAAPAAGADRKLTVTDFDRLQVEGPFQVVLTTGKPSTATLTGTPQALDRVSVEVQGRVLRIRANRSAWGGNPRASFARPTVTVSTRQLRGAHVIGSGSIAVDRAEGMRFDISLSGNGRISVADIETDNLVIGLIGSGSVNVGGKVKTLKATVQGSGSLNAQRLAAEDAEINGDTSGTIDVAARRSAKVTSAGSGEIIVSGKGACTVKQTGPGEVLCQKYSDQR